MSLSLCLSGGGIKGAAHIGVLRAFEESNVKIDAISGTSSGSIIATLYACGYNSDEIYKLFKKYAHSIKYVDWKNIVRLIVSLLVGNGIGIKGLTCGRKLESVMLKACRVKRLEAVEKRLLIPTVDIKTGKLHIYSSFNIKKKNLNEEYYTEGDLSKIVRASCSYPGIFEPCKYNGAEYVDGGLKENIPWHNFRDIGIENIICVTFKELGHRECCKDITNVLQSSFNILWNELIEHEEEGMKNNIEIEYKKIGLLDYKELDGLYEIGYKKGKEFLGSY